MVVQPQEEMGENEAVNEEMDDRLERATTTPTSLDVEQDRGNITKIQSKATPNEPSSLGTSSGGGPRRQKTMGDTIAQTRSENVSKHSNDPLLARDLVVPTLYSCRIDTELLEGLLRSLDWEETNCFGRCLLYDCSFGDQKVASKQGRKIDDIDKDANITLVHATRGDGDEELYDTGVLDGDEVLAEPDSYIKAVPLSVD
ncbi:hypothetical protein Tco_0201083 [Tanacetum coccineum]